MDPEGRRRRGRPKETWRRTVERERGQLGLKGYTEAGSCAKDRDAWRKRTQGPIYIRGKGQDNDNDDDGDDGSCDAAAAAAAAIAARA